MKKIKLTNNKVALVDDGDYNVLNKYKWSAVKHCKTFYAERNSKSKDGKWKTVRMPVVILKIPKGKEVDHRNGNGLDNQRKNLRVCTRSQNAMNRGIINSNTSGFKGVHWDGVSKKWRAQITYGGKYKHLGFFQNISQAYKAYCMACVKYHKDFSKIN